MSGDTGEEYRQPEGQFPATRWSLITQVRGSSEEERSRALSDLCQIYWQPLYSFARSSGYSRPDSEDLTQGFLAELLERKSLDRARPQKGKLRSYLLAGFNKFLAGEYRRGHRQKRGGTTVTIRIEEVEKLEAQLDRTFAPERVFEERWIMTILAVAREKLSASYHARGKDRLFRELVGFLEEKSGAPSYAEVAKSLHQSEEAVGSAIYRLRRQFRNLVRAEIAETLESDDQVDEELRYLCGLLNS